MSSSRLLNGTNQYLQVTGGAPVASVPLSMACWFKVPNITEAHVTISLADENAVNHYFNMDIRGDVGGDPVRAVARGTSQYTAITSSGFSANTWSLGVVVFTNATSRAAYLNGGNKGTETTDQTPAGIDIVTIGVLDTNDEFHEYMNGNIALVTLWDIALGDADVTALWNSGAGVDPTTIQSGNVVAHWFDGTEVDTDHVGSFDLTPYNSPTWDSGDWPIAAGGGIVVLRRRRM